MSDKEEDINETASECINGYGYLYVKVFVWLYGCVRAYVVYMWCMDYIFKIPIGKNGIWSFCTERL